ncbi:MAG: ABC transporter transmembrane domain-containing protein [Pseudomonadota bacterium]
MDTRFFTFVWKYSKREQIFILALTFFSFPLVYASLEIPKIIINDAIDGTDFPKEIFGFELEQIPYLLLLCFTFLGLVFAINGIKWVMNVAIGMTGERMLRRMRFMLFEHVMRFRMERFKTTKPGEVIQSLLGEIEPLGGFIGEVIATPAFQGGLLIVYSVFIFAQDVYLGLAAVALYPIQAWLIPKLQAKVIRLNKERAANTRGLADEIAGSVGNIADIHTNDTARWHLGQIATKLHYNTVIRLALFKRKFTIKFINNLINQLTPFFFYSVGGYLVIKGELDFGSLVAVLAAYKDLAGPWKSVLNFVQRWADFNSRYSFVVENFVGDGVMGPERVYDTEAQPLSGPIEFMGVEGGPAAGGLTVPKLIINQGEMVAVTGGDNGSRDALLGMVAGLVDPTQGRVTIGDKPVMEARLCELGSAVAVVEPEPGLLSRSIRDNMLYGLYRDMPPLDAVDSPEAADFVKEARATGNLLADPDGDWVRYSAAGVQNSEGLDVRLLLLSTELGLDEEIFAAALNSRVVAGEVDQWTDPILEARAALKDADLELDDLVEAWEPETYNTNATVLENILYALPVEMVGNDFDYAKHDRVTKILSEAGADEIVKEMGWDIASEFADLVAAVDEESAVLDAFAAYPKDDLKAAAELFEQNRAAGLSAVSGEGEKLLTSLALKFVLRRDRLDVLSDDRIADLIACRGRAVPLTAEDPDFVGFEEDRFNPSRTIADNLLMGARRIERKSRWKALDDEMERALVMAGLRFRILSMGLDRPAGAGGANLSTSMKRRVALVRAVIKRPKILVLDGIAGGEAEADVRLRHVIRSELPETTVLYAASSPNAASGADRVLSLDENGRVENI